jgi:hypothetical protein
MEEMRQLLRKIDELYIILLLSSYVRDISWLVPYDEWETVILKEVVVVEVVVVVEYNVLDRIPIYDLLPLVKLRRSTYSLIELQCV